MGATDTTLAAPKVNPPNDLSHCPCHSHQSCAVPFRPDFVLTRRIGHHTCVGAAWLAMASVFHRHGSRCPNTSHPSISVCRCTSFRLHLCTTAASDFRFLSPSSHYLGHNAFNSVELCWQDWLSRRQHHLPAPHQWLHLPPPTQQILAHPSLTSCSHVFRMRSHRSYLLCPSASTSAMTRMLWTLTSTTSSSGSVLTGRTMLLGF